MKRLSLALAATLMSLLPAVASATEYSGATFRIESDPNVLPEAGQLYEATFVVNVDHTAQLVSALFETGRSAASGQRHWEPIGLDIPEEQTLVPGTPYRYDFQLFCNEPDEPIWFDVNIDGVTRRRSFHLSPRPVGGMEPVESEFSILPLLNGAAEIEAEPIDESEFAAKRALDPALLAQLEAEEPSQPSKAVARSVEGRVVMSVDSTFGLVPANGATVFLYEVDYGPSIQFLGKTVTKTDGTFELAYIWPESEQPDLYVRVVAANAFFKVTPPVVDNVSYFWEGPVNSNVGDHHDFGDLKTNADDFPLFILSCMTQMHAWLAGEGYAILQSVTVSVPDSDWPHYEKAIPPWSPAGIFLTGDRMWESGVIFHEYGHHVMYNFSPHPSSNGYCNPGNRADYVDGDDACRHAGWCKEDEDVAWAEGFPNWMADRMARLFRSRYGVAAPGEMLVEKHATCSPYWNGDVPETYDDPLLTEHAFAALVRDLEDPFQDIEARSDSLVIDKLEVADGDILAAAFDGNFHPSSPWTFLQHFRTNHYQGSPHDLWSTVFNNGINLDTDPPGTVTNLQCPSHPTSAPSSVSEIQFTWDFAPDDMAGVGGYSVFIANVPTAPNFVQNIGDVEELVTEPLPPGTYYFTIRSVDRVGHWDDDYATIGPVTIKPPDPANLLPLASAFYSFPAVPRPNPLEFPNVASTPSVLSPAPFEFYMNLAVFNDGELPTTATSGIYTYIDGQLEWTTAILASNPLQPDTFVHFENLGPSSVDAGRHTITMVVDGNHALAEPSETDNRDVRQWVFSPFLLSAANPLVRTAPPSPYAGYYLSEQTAFTAPNCKGTRIDAGGQVYSAVSLLAASNGDDYDLRSHAQSTGPLTGFDPAFPSGAWEMAVSMRPPGFTEFVLVNPAEAGADVWDFAILNANVHSRLDPPTNGDFEARRVDSVEVLEDTPLHTGVGAGEVLALYHFTMPARQSGTRVVTLDAAPAAGPLYLAVYPVDVAHAGQADYTSWAATDGLGDAKTSFAATPGDFAIAVWREPVESPGLSAVPFTVEVRAPLADLATSTEVGWDAPLVPRAAADGTPASVPAPTELFGDQPSTWWNASVRNRASVASGAFEAQIALDGEPLTQLNWPGLAGLTPVTAHAATPITVRGGRHTLSLLVDGPDVVEEEEEDNNLFGRQWIFTPAILPAGTMATRAAPPSRSGGYQSVEAAKEVDWEFPNCDGLRLPFPAPVGDDGHWIALFAAPSDTGDVNLNLHIAATGPAAGFATPLVSSYEEAGYVEYVLANFRAQGYRHYDVGITNIKGEEDYRAWTVTSTWLDDLPNGQFGPFGLADQVPAALHEVELAAGTLSIELNSLSPGVDWGLAVHRAKLTTHSRRTVLATSFVAGPGENENLVVDVPEPGKYCIAVYRSRNADLAGVANYELIFGGSATAVAPTALGSGARVALQPNPFNPRTTVHFELEAAGPARLRIYDARGAVVRTLVQGFVEAGRREVVWDGTDERGRAVGSGVYFARLEAAGRSWVAKGILVK